jgi:uncharacterized peroxidase-related enzyme
VAEAIKADWRAAERMSPADYAMLDYVEKLTINPSGMTEADVQGLRAVGWTDRDILDIVQVCAYFNFRLRVVDALGLKLSEETVKSARAGRERASELAQERGAQLPVPMWELDQT